MSNIHLLNNRPKRNNSKGFYIALGVCLVAVGVAAWTTYDSVVNYANPEQETESSASAAPANDTVSGVQVVVSQPEPASSRPASAAAAASKAPSSAAPRSSVPARQTGGKVLTFAYPVSKTVEKEYSGENPVFSKTMKDWRAHTGVDLAAKLGDEVKASADGTVKDAYSDTLYGNTVIITHGDVEAQYSGLNLMSVKKGDKVKAGQKIGTLGVVPCESADASHLHFAMKRNGKWIDPTTLLK